MFDKLAANRVNIFDFKENDIRFIFIYRISVLKGYVTESLSLSIFKYFFIYAHIHGHASFSLIEIISNMLNAHKMERNFYCFNTKK